MTITVVKHKGVTVVTVATDSESTSPLLCQILKTLCCCSVNKVLMRTNVTAALGAIQIMVGLLNIRLGPEYASMYPGGPFSMADAHWLGGVIIIAAGIMSLLASRFPSLCLVIFAVFVNVVGSSVAIFGIVLYGADLFVFRSDYAGRFDDLQRLLTTMDIATIVLAVLQLCVCIRFAVLGFKAVANGMEEEGEDQKPLLKEVLLTIPGA